MKIAIIGGGPSGVYFAIKLLELVSDVQITIFDDKPILHSLLPTGNGRCNLTYNESNPRQFAEYFPRGEKFLISVFSRYGLADTLLDFEKYGINTYIQNDNRIFPTENSSAFVKKKLLEQIYNKVKFERKKVLSKVDGYDAVVLSTGLKTGANLAKLYGHNIIPLKPSLTGLKIAESEFNQLQGVSLNGIVFTDVGVSGPYIFKLSSINAYSNYPYKIEIPLVNIDELTTCALNNPKKLFRTVVADFIPKSLANILVKTDKQCANVSKSEISLLEKLVLTVTGVDNKGEIVHAGGVDLAEVDKNMKSKIHPNLWIIGELLNVDGFTGGFNLQNCWSTAAIAARDVADKILNHEN